MGSPRLAIIPNAITVAGIFLGFLALAWAADHPYWAGNAIIGATICDLLDGRIARLTKTQTAFGVQLDSLADVISFGVAPAYLLYQWGLRDPNPPPLDPLLLVVFVFVAAGAIRLARFNVGSGSGEVGYDIAGMTIPVAALIPTGLVMTAHELDAFDELRQPGLIVAILLVNSALMVSRIPFPSYKRFRHRATMFVFYGTVLMGCTLVLLRGPGGTVLLTLLSIYTVVSLIRAAVKHVARAPATP